MIVIARYVTTCLLLAAAPLALGHEAREYCARAEGYPFGIDSSEGTIQYGRDRQFDVKHIRLEVKLDFETETVSGVATHRMSPVGTAASEIAFDAVNMDVSSVTDGNDGAFDFELTDERLRVFLPEPAAPGEELTVAIAYSTTRPERGMHFRTGRLGYPEEETQAWTQGEPEDARHWFPCLDYPNERATTEVICTVRDDFVALSNGNLIGTTHNAEGGTKTFHWSLPQEHVTYLVSLVAGPYVAVTDTVTGVPLYYYVLPGQEDRARITYANTPEMMKVFQDVIGVPYPYDRYSQVSVVDFIAGGMENTTITTMTERILLDESAMLTRDMDGLIAHELAHHWFGDLLTCRDWSHIWLNEGFATYLEAVYSEHALGRDAMIHDVMQNQWQVLRADGGEGKKPMASKNYDDANAVFGYRAYAKGACVLHMLRHELGDELFWRSIKTYVERFRNRVVETNDLMRTAEEVSGKSLERFFDQWVYRTGYPELTVRYAWDDKQGLAKVTVQQTQALTAQTPLFVFDTTIAFHGKSGVRTEPIRIDDAEQTVFVPLDERPEFVRIDPDGAILKALKFDKPKAMLLAQLASDSSIVGRYQACAQLAEQDGDDVVEALANALNEDSFWGVRAEAAEALGKMDNDKSADMLIGALPSAEGRVRLSIVNALGTIDRDESRAALIALVESDPASYVVSACIDGLAALDAREAIPQITAALERDSHAETIRSAALGALAKLDAETSLEAITPFVSAPKPRMSRRAAISALGQIGEFMEDKSAVRDTLTGLLDSPHPFHRGAAIEALKTLGDPTAIDSLEVLANTSKREDEAKRARDAIATLRTRLEPSSEMKTLREQVDTLKKDGEELNKKVEALQRQLEALPKAVEVESDDDGRQ